MNVLSPDAGAETYAVVKPLAAGLGSRSNAVSVVVPCFNEEQGLDQLTGVLRETESRWPQYNWRFIFVNDCSTDRTLELLTQQFSEWPNAAVLSHHHNLGITGAILSGTRYADSEIVCSIDSDCTYDPRDLGALVQMIEAGNDMVTASPYHPEGGVAGVPAWRLILSRAASMLYRAAFRAHVYTFTACYRAYRRSAVMKLNVENPQYGGLAEMLLLLMIDGGRIAEFPTVLKVRQFGQSKMKVVRTIMAHLTLMRRLAPVSWSSRTPRGAPIPAPATVLALPRGAATDPATIPGKKAA
ncbi:MAG: glycosyltransferase family 2 protein [Planctomycetaceae bacterium]|nr:glycosyltransferase family 2 protein [Planctomycetaceae bacterium]